MGAAVRVYLSTPPSQLADVPRLQYDILERIGVSIEVAQPDAGRQMADLVVDALIGYSLRGAPRGVAASLVRGANAQASPVIALDVPSGLDTTSGAAHEPTMQATATMTLALPKVGLRSEGAKAHVGELYLADISVPPSYTPALR
jgi:NAD(P)H-hydrate epimerase